jgi:hypothetical protein
MSWCLYWRSWCAAALKHKDNFMKYYNYSKIEFPRAPVSFITSNYSNVSLSSEVRVRKTWKQSNKMMFISPHNEHYLISIRTDQDFLFHVLFQYTSLAPPPSRFKEVSCSDSLVSIVTWRLKARIVESEETSIARQRLGKHVSATMEVLAELMTEESREWVWGLAVQLWKKKRGCEEKIMCAVVQWYLECLPAFIPVAPTWSKHRASVKKFVSFQFLNLRQSVELLGRGISPSKGRYLHRTTQTENKRRQTSMPWVGFVSTIPVFERTKTFHASEGGATVIGCFVYSHP